jgi:putative endonuclease
MLNYLLQSESEHRVLITGNQRMASETPYYVYMLLCADQTIYTGITNNVLKRVESHNTGVEGTKYTRSRRPVTLLAVWKCKNRSEATKLEIEFKALTRAKKISLAHEQGTGLLTDAD